MSRWLGKYVFWVIFIVLLSFGILGVNSVFAATSDTISFQSKLVNSDGTNVADNTYNYRFLIYSESSGGTALWSEDQSVAVSSGVVSVRLGSQTPFPATLFDNADLYLQVCLDGNGVDVDSSDANCGAVTHRYEEVFTSRKPITAVPIALRAKALTDSLGNSYTYNSFFRQGGNAFNAAGVLGTTDNNALRFITNNVTAMTITAAGTVGIGTELPDAKLHIETTSSQVGLIIKGTLGQAVNLTEWKNTLGYTVASVSETGELRIIGSGAPPATSYSNLGGTGARGAIITTTTTLTSMTGSITSLVNGGFGQEFYFNGGESVVGKEIKFDFLSPVVIDEAKYYQDRVAVQGAWKWQGSNNGTDWTDIGVSFSMGTATTQVLTELSGNISAYRYYRLYGVSGVTNWNPWVLEMEFKIGVPSSGLPTVVKNGYIGIGTLTPTYNFHLEGAGTSAFFGGNMGVGAVDGAYSVNVVGNGRFSTNLVVGTTLDLGSSTPSSSLARISGVSGTDSYINSGRFGIGTTTPYYQFQVKLGTNSLAYFGNSSAVGNGVYSGIGIGYSENGPTFAKSAIVQEQLGDSAARGKIHILNNGTGDSSNATLADARLTINYDGNIGIGTTSPQYNLDLGATSSTLNVGAYNGGGSATIRLLGESLFYFSGGSAGSVLSMGSADSGMDFDLSLDAGGAGRLYIDGATGNVGIGTTIPQSLLSLGSEVTAQKLLVYDSANVRYGFGIQSGEMRMFSASNGVITLGTISTSDGSSYVENVRITAAGNVGVGISSPGARLHLYGNNNNFTSANSGLLTENINSTGYATTDWKNNLGHLTQMTVTGSAFSNGMFNADSASITTNGAGGINLVAYDAAGVIRFGTGGFAVGNERMRISATGNVGIGTTAPLGKLDVYTGTADAVALSLARVTSSTTKASWFSVNSNDETVFTTTNASLDFRTNYNGGSQLSTMYLSASGQVGIGTSPTGNHMLDVNKNPGSTLTVFAAFGDVNGSNGLFYLQGSDTVAGVNSRNNQDLAFYVANTERLRIQYATGNVGIGTSTGSAKLTVNGDISVPTQAVGSQAYRINIGTYGTISETAGGLSYITGNAVAASLTANNQIQKTANDAGQFIRMRYDTGISFHTNITGATGTSLADTTNTRLMIDLSGNVGINTAVPYYALHVATSENSLAFVGNQVITAGSYTGVGFGYTESGTYAKSAIVQEQIGDGAARGKVHILNNGTADASSATLADARLTVDYNGNVGIGNTSPAHRLDVNGNIGIASSGYLNYGATDGTAGYGIRDNGGILEYKDQSGSWVAFNTLSGSGSGLAGGVIASVTTVQTREQGIYATLASGNGTEITPLSIVLTPKKAGNKVILEWVVSGEGPENVVFLVSRNGVLMSDSTDSSNNYWSGVAVLPYDQNNSTTPNTTVIRYIDGNSLDVASTYRLLVRSSFTAIQSSFYLNRTFVSAGADNQEALMSTGIATEIDPDAVSNLFVQNGNAFGATGILGTTDNYALQLVANNSTAMTILPNGNIGIGDTLPSQKLSVAGTLGIRETGTSPTYYTVFQGGDQSANITYTLPTASANGVLRNTGGVLTWDTAVTANYFTDSGAITYLTSTTDNFAVGGTTSASKFYFDSTSGRLTMNQPGSTAGIYFPSNVGLYGTTQGILQTNSSFEALGKVYSFGGTSLFGTTSLFGVSELFALNKVSSLDTLGTWDVGSEGDVVRFGITAHVYKGKIYYAMGADGGAYHNTIAIYDIERNTWLANSAAGGTARSEYASALYNGKIYIWGGTAGSGAINTMDIYDIESNTWSTGLAGGTARTGHVAVEFRGKIYFLSGVSAPNVGVTVVDIYDITSNTWSTGAANGNTRSGASAVLYNGNIYVWGGVSTIFPNDAMNVFDRYDILSNTWGVSFDTSGVGRGGHTSVLYNGKMYSFFGSSLGALQSVDIYDFATGTGTDGVTGGEDFHTEGAGVLYNGKVYIWGGYDSTTSSMDVYDIGDRQTLATLYDKEAGMLSFRSEGVMGLDYGKLSIMGGNVGIGVSNPTYTLQVNGNTANTTGVWTNYSDARLKNNIAPITDALGIITQLQGVTFNWNDPEKNEQYGNVRGFIAQDVEKVIPDWVITDDNGIKAIQPIGMEALLVEAIKEQQAQINQLMLAGGGTGTSVSGWALNNETLSATYNVVAPGITATTADINVLRARTLNLNDLFMVDDQGRAVAQSLVTSLLKSNGSGLNMELISGESFTVSVAGIKSFTSNESGTVAEKLNLTDKQAGKIVILAGQTEVVIPNIYAKTTSVVIASVNGTKAVPLAVRAVEGSIIIRLAVAETQDIDVNWVLFDTVEGN